MVLNKDQQMVNQKDNVLGGNLKNRQDHGRKVLFENNVVFWKFNQVRHSKRNRIIRPKGTMVKNKIISIDKIIIKNLLIK